MQGRRASDMPPTTRAHFHLLFLLVAVAMLANASDALAAPGAHILRIDPRASIHDGKPTLTTVIDVVQFQGPSDVLLPCARTVGSDVLDCWSAQLERPHALWLPFPFPEANAHLLVQVGGAATAAGFVDKAQWGTVQAQSSVGTAWLVCVDASSAMGPRFLDAREIAHELIDEMRPNDLMDLMFFDDVQTVRDSKWVTFAKRASLADALNALSSTMPSHGSDRALFRQIEVMTRDAFGSLGNSDAPDQTPLHQAMVLLSNGTGRGDPESASPSADVFHQYLDGGRFPADNTSLPKTPLPVASIWLPNPSGYLENIYQNNEAQFMQALSNPEIGGFFDVVRQGQGAAKAKTIVSRLRERFDAMWLVHWELSCINPSVEQSFDLEFENTNPLLTGDGSFKSVPLGIDPASWPLDVDMRRTVAAATTAPIYPGGEVTVYGNFCWSGDASRAEAYFIPTGTRPPANSGSLGVSALRSMQQQLQSENMAGKAVRATDSYVVFQVPDNAAVLDGAGPSAVSHLIVYDNRAHRASSFGGLTLAAAKRPLSWPLIGGIVGLSTVFALLAVVVVGGGSGRRKRPPNDDPTAPPTAHRGAPS
jgi:hypothetical protein